MMPMQPGMQMNPTMMRAAALRGGPMPQMPMQPQGQLPGPMMPPPGGGMQMPAPPNRQMPGMQNLNGAGGGY